MIYARVAGTAVATVKHEVYQGHKVMVVDPLTPYGKPQGKSFLAVDAVQAGVGDKVLVSREGNAARQILKTGEAPVHSVIIAIVDTLELEEENL